MHDFINDGVQLIFGVSILAGLLYSIYRIGRVEKMKITPIPLPTQEQERHMTVPMHDASVNPILHRVGTLEADVRSIRLKMESDKNEIINAGERRSVAIHERINDTLKAISELRGEVTGRFSKH